MSEKSHIGDEPTTAIYTAKQCGIIQKTKKVMLGSLEAFKDADEERTLHWSWVSYPDLYGEFEDLESPRSKFSPLETGSPFSLNLVEMVTFCLYFVKK